MSDFFANYSSTLTFFDRAGFKSLHDLTYEIEKSLLKNSANIQTIQDQLFCYYGYSLAAASNEMAKRYFSLSFEEIFQQACLQWAAIVRHYNPQYELTFKEYCGNKYQSQLTTWCARQLGRDSKRGIAEANQMFFETHSSSAEDELIKDQALEHLIEISQCHNASKSSVAKHLLTDRGTSSEFLARMNRTRGWLSQHKALIKLDILNKSS